MNKLQILKYKAIEKKKKKKVSTTHNAKKKELRKQIMSDHNKFTFKATCKIIFNA